MNKKNLKNKNIKNSKIVFPIAVGFTISIVLNFLINLNIGLNPNLLDDNFRIILGQISNWIIVVILLSIIFFWEKNSLESAGIKKFYVKDLIWGFIALIVGFIIFFISDVLINSLNFVSQSSERVHFLLIPFIIRIFMVFTTGITEEIIFRGYLIERTNMITNSLIFSSIISLIVFTIFHIPFWGIIGALQVGFWAIPITILYVRLRNLPICIIIHIIYDATILLSF